jgi:hypothetical protein
VLKYVRAVSYTATKDRIRSNFSPIRADFLLAARSASQGFFRGELELRRLKAGTFLSVAKPRFLCYNDYETQFNSSCRLIYGSNGYSE